MRRWAIKVAVGGFAILILVGVVVQFVLWSDLPRRWILRAASEQSGLNVTAESLSVGWTGRTTVRGVTVATPLNEEHVLTVETADLSHRSIPLLLITRSLGLDSIRMGKPQINLRRDKSGRWNVQDVAARLAGSARSDSGGPAGETLPRVEIRDALVHITDPNETIETIGPVNLLGVNNGLSTWGFNLKAPQGIELHGELAQGGNWAQRIDFDIALDESLIGAVLRPDSGPFRISGRWTGRIETGRLVGNLQLDCLEAGPAALAGTVNVALGGDRLTLRPNGLAIIEPNLAGQKLRFTAGSIVLDRGGLQADQLTATTQLLVSQISGRWHIGARRGDFSVDWAGTLPGRGGHFNGTSEIAIKSPPSGRKEVALKATLTTHSQLGELYFGTEIQGAGGRWRESLWETAVSELNWTSQKGTVDLGNATAKIAVDWPQVQLMSLTLPNAREVNAAAELNAETLRWSVRIDAKGFKGLGDTDSGLDIRLDGSGDRDEAVIAELGVTKGDRVAVAKGKLAVSSGEIREAHVSANWPDRRSAAVRSKPGGEPGRWGCEVDVEGKARPVDLRFDGTMVGRNIRLGRRNVPQLDVPLRGTASAERVEISTEPFDLLGGRWQLSGRHELSNPMTQLGLTIEDLSLQAAAEMAGSPLRCRGQAKARLQLAVPDFTIDKTLAYGSWDVEGLSIPPFEARQGHGKLRISGGTARFDEIQLEQGQGEALGSMQFRLDQPQRLSITFKTTDWPLEWEPQAAKVLVDSDANVTVDIQAKSLNGQAQVAGRLLLDNENLGRLSASARLRERILDLHELNGEILGGPVQGSAQIPLDQWVNSLGQLRWQGIEPNQLTPWWPRAAGFAGTLSGTLTVGQKDADLRALEPMRLELRAEMPNGHFGRASLEDCHVIAYLGRDRLLIDKVDIHAMRGLISGWARVTPHEDRFYLTNVIDFNDIDMDHVSQVVGPNQSAKVAGLLSGRTTILTSSDWRHLSGQADLHISKSDLANTPVLRTLYNTLSLKLGQTEPEGTGRVKLQFDGQRIRIPSFVYFNRGVEVRGAGEIKDFTRGGQSAVQGYAVGSTRVLKEVRLPGVKELDRLMASMQTGVASVTIDGTLEDAQVAVVPLPVVSGPLRRLLWSQLRE